MKITLISTGGFIPITKKAEKEVDWREDEMQSLLDSITTGDEPGQARDKTTYLLSYNGETFPIDWDKIPAKYKRTFENLKGSLVIEKR